jgi:release factor glutamine methyltransferase
VSARAAAKEAATRLAAAAFEAELLARVAGNLDRAQYFAGCELPPPGREAFAEMVSRRLQREPSAYITREREFLGRPFLVTPAVLIPRPETELLVEAVLAERDAFGRSPVVADIGTGSGCIAVSLALGWPGARVVGVDRSPEALAVAHVNAGRHGAAVALVRGGLATALGRADAVVANLPYIPSEEIASLQPEVRDWEPRLAIDGGGDGLALVRALVADCGGRLRPRLVALEVGFGQAATVAALLHAAGADTAIAKDYAGIERMVFGRWG